jgi:hypothetical protein
MTLVAAPPRHVVLTTWRGGVLAGGSHQGTAVADSTLVLAEPVGTLVYQDPYAANPRPTRYEWAAWVSPEVDLSFGATAVLPSWNAETPGDSWLLVEARTATTVDGVRHWSPWFTLARWADTDREIHATSVPGQRDASTRVDTDVLEATGGGWSTAQVRVGLLRRVGSTARPRVSLVALMASAVPAEPPDEVSAGGAAWGVELDVPPYSQQLHRDEFLHWDNGGRSWCSPTTTSMLMAFHDRLPQPDDYAWVGEQFADPFVVQAARRVFDYAYGGAGNWAFNMAYAARHGLSAFVTRLRSLTEAERLVAAGIPLGATVSFPEDGGLTGAGYGTEGHLLTIVGFTTAGDVICNDPASHRIPSNDEVRVVYDRAEFERFWLGSSGGIVYVVHPADVPLPDAPDPTEPNW